MVFKINEQDISEQKKQKLEELVNGFNGSQNIIRKSWNYLWASYYGGSLPHKYQEDFAEKISSNPRILTTLNALVFGAAYSALYHYLGEGGGYLVSLLSDKLDIAPKILGDSFALFDISQSLFRLIYANITKKGIISISPAGFLATGSYALYKEIKSKKIKNN